MNSSRSVDAAEIARFAAKARVWWDTDGEFAQLHRLNPVRLGFIREHVLAHFGRNGAAGRPYAGLTVLDIGCGGGLLTEPMARLGAAVTGIDPAHETIAVAAHHARESGLDISYRAASAEDLAAEGTNFDVVMMMEVVEHVADIGSFVGAAGALTKPGGLLFAATINRTVKSFALAIVGAEYVLGWVPRGTHRWDRFVTPAELDDALVRAKLAPLARAGVVYNPLGSGWQRGRDMDVNYMLAASKTS